MTSRAMQAPEAPEKHLKPCQAVRLPALVPRVSKWWVLELEVGTRRTGNLATRENHCCEDSWSPLAPVVVFSACPDQCKLNRYHHKHRNTFCRHGGIVWPWIQICKYVRMIAHVHYHAYVPAFVCVYIYIHIYTYTCVYMHEHVCTPHVHIYSHTYIHTYTHTHTNTHAHTHTVCV